MRELSTERVFQIAATEEEKEAIFRFRFHIFTTELGRSVPGSSAASRMIRDAEDDLPSTVHFYLGTPSDMRAVMRVRIKAGEAARDLVEDYRLTFLEGHQSYQMAELGRFMVGQELRGSLKTMQFVSSILAYLASNKTDIFVASCKPSLVLLYSKLGLCAYSRHFLEYPDGIEVPLVALVNYQYGKSVASPMRFIVEEWDTRIREADIRQTLLCLERSSIVVDPTRVADALEHGELLEHTAFAAFPFLKDAVGTKALVLDIRQPLKLIHPGMKQQEFYLVLSGSVRIMDERGAAEDVTAGALVGDFQRGGNMVASFGAYVENAVLLVLAQRHLSALERIQVKRVSLPPPPLGGSIA